jgi:tetratricopeptide (TPR) repeat protein
VRPTDDQLRRFLAGRLPDAEAELVGRWVESDPSAASVLARLESADSLADALAEPSTRVAHRTPGLPPDHAAVAELPAGYRLLGELGRGGMGVVYRAVDEEIDREVAVKVLAAHLPRRSGIEARFRDEARITAQLQHPGIPPVYRVGGLPDGRPFLAMKLIKGDTLADLLRHAPAGVNRLGVFEAICQAVGYAHAHGVIHRDLKPANVMVGAFGEVQVMDWGLAKVLVSRECERPEPADPARPTEIKSLRDSDTRAGSVMGTPAFMAPEQAIGASDRLDRRTDVFGLGGVLCVLLTGHPPYSGSDTEAVRQLAARAMLDDCFARLDGCGAEPDLLALCKKCLSAEPENRPADGQAVATDVAALRAAADERARRAEIDREKAVVESREQRKRQRVLLWAAGAVAAVLLLGAAVSLWQMFRAMGAEGLATANEAAAERNAERARTERDAKDKALGETTVALNAKTVALAAEQESYTILRSGLDAMTADIVGESLAAQKTVSEAQKKFLASVLPLYQKLADKGGEDERSRLGVAEAATRVGMIEYRLGRSTEAIAALRQAREGFAALAAIHPDPGFRVNVASCHGNLAILFDRLGRRADAEAENRKSLDLYLSVVTEFPDAPCSGHNWPSPTRASVRCWRRTGIRPPRKRSTGVAWPFWIGWRPTSPARPPAVRSGACSTSTWAPPSSRRASWRPLRNSTAWAWVC